MRVLLIDDTREESSPSVMRRVDLIARNYWIGLEAITKMGPWDLILLDHDLNSFEGSDGTKTVERTGYDIICIIERLMVEQQMPWPKAIICVSSNPPGRARINQVIEKLYGKLPRI